MCLTTADLNSGYSAEKASRKIRDCLSFIKDEGEMLAKSFKVSECAEGVQGSATKGWRGEQSCSGQNLNVSCEREQAS